MREDIRASLGTAREFHKRIGLAVHGSTLALSGDPVATDEAVHFRLPSLEFQDIDAVELSRGGAWGARGRGASRGVRSEDNADLRDDA